MPHAAPDPNTVTDTGRWSLVIQRVAAQSAELWAGTLFTSMKMPENARLRIVNTKTGAVTTSNISKAKGHWKRPFQALDQRFYVVRKFTKLTTNCRYRVYFETKRADGTWMELRDGSFDTLPSRVPTANQRPFTIGLGSCFWDHRDGGRAAASYRAIYERGAAPPHIKFLTGDQVYLDIGFDTLSPRTKELKERIAEDYAKHWQSLGSMLTRGGTWMLPDDHEYWNDYPFYKSAIPQLQALRLQSVREAWTDAAVDGVQRVQRSKDIEIFTLGTKTVTDLSVCLADLRSYRGENYMMEPERFKKLIKWARSLKSPGVLAIPQPLIVQKNKTERNLLSYKAQYEQLLWALGESGHDVVLLSGDVHFGRVAQCALGNNGGRLIEVISSPLSNLTSLSSVATSAAKHVPKKFPDSSLNLGEWDPAEVAYSTNYDVPTRKGFPFGAYWKKRTKEHFMTVSFCRKNGAIELSAQSWLVRERSTTKHLPKKGFKTAFKTKLR